MAGRFGPEEAAAKKSKVVKTPVTDAPRDAAEKKSKKGINMTTTTALPPTKANTLNMPVQLGDGSKEVLVYTADLNKKLTIGSNLDPK
jgi:hypothetical protein